MNNIIAQHGISMAEFEEQKAVYISGLGRRVAPTHELTPEV